MSIKSAKAYLAKVKTDSDFAKKVAGFKDAAGRRAFIKQAGFEFTVGELKEAGSELSDKELDAVAGGGCLLDSCGVGELF